MAAVLLGFISRPEELDLPLLSFDFVLVLLEFLFGCDVWISHRLRRNKCKLIAIIKLLFLCDSVPIIPAWLCVVCVPLAAVKTPSGQQKMPERISPTLLVSSAALSAHSQGSSVWDLDEKSSVESMNVCRMFEVYFSVILHHQLDPGIGRLFFGGGLLRTVTLVCVGAVQLPVQRSDDGGQIGAKALLPQVHGYGSQELKHTCSL